MAHDMYRRSRTSLLGLAVACALAGASAGQGQTIIFNSNGFEPTGYTNGSLGSYLLMSGQQGWLTTDLNGIISPTTPAGTIQSGTAAAGSQAFQVVGPNLQNDSGFSSQTFWYRNFPNVATAFNPVTNGTPIVRVAYDQRVGGTAQVSAADIPLVGIYMEGYYGPNASDTQLISSLMVDLNGALNVISVTGLALRTANSTFTRDAWQNLAVDFNFSTQTFTALLNGTPLQFSTSGNAPYITSVPFRNTNGPTLSLYEYGFQAAFNTTTGLPSPNSAYFDNYTVTAFTTVPEPSSLALAGVGLVGAAWRLRRRRAAAKQG